MKTSDITKEDMLKLLEYLGGKDNILSSSHCVSRIRLEVVDKDLIDIPSIEEMDFVKGSFYSSGQFQIVIGPEVKKVYDLFLKYTGIKEVSYDQMKENIKKNSNWFQRLVKMLGEIFIPILPAIVASGLLMGIFNLLSNPGIFAEDPLIQIYPQIAGLAEFINTVANTAFVFLPVLVAYSATKRFGGNPILGMTLGLLLVHPDLVNMYTFAENPAANAQFWTIFGIPVLKVGYQAQVLPVIFSAFILSKIEMFLDKRVPSAINLVVVPPVTLILTAFITFLAIGPVVLLFSFAITEGILWLFTVSPILAGFVYGFISAPLVVTGMHHLFLTVNLSMQGSLGYVTLWPISETVTFAQGIAAFTMFFIFRDNVKQKSIALSAGISAWFGITEPAIYGVNLRYRYPFLAVMIASGVGSAFLSFNQIKATSVGVGGIFSFLSVYPNMWPIYFTGMAITGFGTIALTLIFKKIYEKRGL